MRPTGGMVARQYLLRNIPGVLSGLDEERRWDRRFARDNYAAKLLKEFRNTDYTTQLDISGAALPGILFGH